ncbi:MAG: PH domain-containing protein [Clostridium sp.]|uniref:PH domain-containing protein n=1 Tax=Clostridium sp. TaxID=1506 RepID=UPI00290D0A2C|nr:PH domain-containing protein [Clostridium sp.]MDU5109758.1 PH domain-containing protein [Clostridium sp.]
MGFGDLIKGAIDSSDRMAEQKQVQKEEKEKRQIAEMYKKYADYLLEEENILYYTSNIKGSYVFLDKRILFHDDRLRKVTKQEYHSIPYKNIKRFTIEKAGVADIDTDIKLYLGGSQEESITLKVPIDSTKAINKIIVSKII